MAEFSRRTGLQLLAGGAGALALGGLSACGDDETGKTSMAKEAGAGLSPITGRIAPITAAERRARIEKLQRLMRGAGLGAVVIEPGASMIYFSGIHWWRSERLTALVIPAEGEVAVVTPFFEEPSVRESLVIGEDVRTWHEHESPFERVAGILRDRGVASAPVGLEGTVRYFVADGLRRAMPGVELRSGQPVVDGCRVYKSAAEIALMKKANAVTLAAYEHTYRRLKTGMTPADIVAIMNGAQVALGGTDPWAIALVGEASAYPHGSDQPQVLKDGEILLMDCGCAVEGYQSDISRSWVHGAAASARQREVWDLMKAGQDLVFENARLGRPAGELDGIVRAFYESHGYGPDYETPGLPHRTGHGIGLDGHEPVNLVKGETTPLAPGMCFSNEPGIYIYGEFGIRLEDCMYMAEDGPHWFSKPQRSIEDPFAA